jgi:hypothetical protein
LKKKECFYINNGDKQILFKKVLNKKIKYLLKYYLDIKTYINLTEYIAFAAKIV